ncbi:cilia- and flagella-associated protein 45 isoform X2 [Gasterosteus aculeatus]
MRRASSSPKPRGGSCTRRYRTLAASSQVDESLFGSPTPSQKDGNSAPKKKSRGKQEREIVQIVTKDLIRTLRIPLKDPPGCSVVLPPEEFQRITSRSHILTKEEREALKEGYQSKEEETSAAEERKRQIYEATLWRKENQALNELELEARDRAQRLVERANALRMEEEVEIRELNKLILAAQCQATRDDQVDEKKRITTELSEEDKRLDAMMEEERLKALATVEQIDELRRQQRIGGMESICDQIRQHLTDKEMQELMKEQEKEQAREKLERMNLEDLKAMEKKREEQQHLQDEIIRINTETMRAKEQRREEEKLADMRNMEYMKNKTQREAEYEAEQRRIRKEKEIEVARLRTQQEKAKDYKSEQDELRARRNQEIAEREWRRKEKERRAKAAQEKATMTAAHAEQVRRKERLLSMEMGREKAENERLLRAHQEATLREKQEEERKQQKARQHADAIRNQVKERVLSAAAKRKEMFKEADQCAEAARQRRVRLDEIKEKKLTELKATGLSEKYCSEVEKKARAAAL